MPLDLPPQPAPARAGRWWRRRPLPGALAAVAVAALVTTALVGGSGATASDDPGTATTAPGPGRAVAAPAHQVTRRATPQGTWSCAGDLAGAERQPVLLVHGAALNDEENWGTTLAPHLTGLGFPVCRVSLRSYGTRDVQDNVEVVASAVRTISTEAGRPIDVVGHSLGAYLPRAALRLHPALAADVDDVVGLAGVYDLGSRELVERCGTACVPVLHQMATGSDLLRAVARRPLPAGPSYTNIGSTGDQSVTPQPSANHQRGARSVLVQDVCPGRDLGGSDHALLVGDAVAGALLVDALDHPGPADPTRIPPETCAQDWYAGFDPDAFMAVVARTGPRTSNGRVDREPALECRLRPDCRYVSGRGAMLGAASWDVGRYLVVLSATARQDGTVRLSVGRRSVEATVRVGDPVRLRVPRSGSATGAMAATMPRYYSVWVAEARRSLRR